MKNKFLNGLLLVCLFIISNVAVAEHVSDPELVAKGAKLYSENCGRCHNPRPASDYSKKEWSVVMPHMREKAHMTGKESLAVEAFLASTLTADARNDRLSETETKTVRSGATLVKQFGCLGCHSIKDDGGTLGPALDNVVKLRGRAFVFKKLKNPKFDNAASAMPRFPMSDKEIESIIKFMSDR